MLQKRMRSLKVLMLAFIVLAIFPMHALAIPTIAGVSGSLSNGNLITITGANFGSKDQASPLISSYDNPVPSNNWHTGTIGPNWNVIGSVRLNSDQPRTSFYQSSNKVVYDADGNYANVGYNHITDDDKLYVSWWMYRDYSVWRGNASGGGNSKFFRVYTNSAAGDSIVLSLWWDGFDLAYAYGQAEYAPNCPDWNISYTATSATKSASKFWRVNFGNDNPRLQSWEHYEILIDYPATPGSTDASITLWKNGRTVWRCTNVALDTANSLDNERLIRIGQVSGDRTESQNEYIDQVYIDNSVAHVFISDSPNVSWPDNASTHHDEIQVCSAWSDSSITFTLNQGSFSSGQTVYLYVVNTNGEISPGYPITIGGSGGDSQPSISITSPTTEQSYNSTNDTIDLTGSANDDTGISSITWANDRGGSGTASNDSGDWSEWSIANIPLQEGENVITVTATDTAGQTGTDTITVTYTIPGDTTPPSVQIISPTGDSTYETTSSLISLSGTASDDSQVSSVTWANDQGGSGTASGTTSWSINGIALQEGENEITVTAHDSSGNTASDTITVTYNVPQGTYTKAFGDATDCDYTGTVQDTFLNINTDINADSQTLNTYTWPTDKPANAVVMKWDLSAIPAGAQIQSATLYLYMNSMEVGGGDDTYDVSVHKIINHNPDIEHCTGYTYDGTHSWTANNSCYNNIPLAQADIAQAEDTKSLDKTYGYKTWNVTNMVRDWIGNPSTNYGLLLNSDSSASANSNRFFASSEATDPSQRPKLVITYVVGDDIDTTPPGDVTDVVATPGIEQVALSWKNPPDSDFAGVMIRYRTDGTFPVSHTDGTAIPNGNNGKIAGAPNGTGSYTHTGLDPNLTYHYSIFTYDTAGNYSNTAHVSASPLPPEPVNSAPSISYFSATPNPADNPLKTINFSVQASDPDGDALTYTIDFGDNSPASSGSSATHAYSSKGTYSAKVTVSDGNGHTAEQSLSITINDSVPAKVTGVAAN